MVQGYQTLGTLDAKNKTHGHFDSTAERCDARVENLPDVGSGVISQCSKLPNVDAVRLVGIGHRQGESLTLLGKTCNNIYKYPFAWLERWLQRC